MANALATDEPTYWISVPVVAAIVPAVVGLTYENGAAIATDLLILGMAAWFLHWCVSVPWHWYHAAQERTYHCSDVVPAQFDDDIPEEDEQVMESAEERPQSSGEGNGSASQTEGQLDSSDASLTIDAQENARKALRQEELTALVACFVGPLLGAALLHKLRAQLTRTEGIVSDFNLVIFVMFAEFRPFKQLIKLRNDKIMHLQRIVKTDPEDHVTTQYLANRVFELEARLEGPLPGDIDITQISEKVTKSTQLQIDGLTRAVRRYEKRAMAQTLQTEARFDELETRMRDALSLAAAAARTGQQPGILALAMRWVINTIRYTCQTAWHVVLYPFRVTASTCAYLESYFIEDGRQSRKKMKVNAKAYPPMSTSRIYSKTRS